jgi:predicted transcriptional regulator
MLNVAMQSTTKTRLMCGAFLSFDQIDKVYLPLLLENSLLEYNSQTKKYKTTNLGQEFLKKSETLRL